MPARPVRLLLCDDQNLVRARVREILARVPSFEVVGEAADGRSAVDLALELKPDLVLMDVSMPKLTGAEATQQLVARLPGIRILAFSADASAEHVNQMRAAGARGYLLKTGHAEELLAALTKVLAGEPFFVAPGSRLPDGPRPEGR